MAITLGEALQQLADRLGPGNLNATLTRRYMAALDRSAKLIYGKRNWDWLWTVGEVTVPVASATKYWADLPDDCRGVLSCGLMSTGQSLVAISLEAADAIEGLALKYMATRSAGTPGQWCARANKLYLIPPSGLADKAVIAYIRKYVPITVTTQAVLIPDDYDTMWVDYAFASLADSDEFSQRAAARAQRDADKQMRNLHMTGSNMQAVIQRFHYLLGQH